MKTVMLAAALIIGDSPPSLAQTSPESEERYDNVSTEIVVTGLRDPFKLSAKQLRAMHQAFLKYRPRYAPNAVLALRLNDTDFADEQPTPRLSISGEDWIDIPYNSAARSFVFPSTIRLGKNAELVSNWKKGALGLTPFVHSPGTSISDRTIGDLRLQCEVMWAGMRSEMSFVARTAFAAAGACGSSKISFFYATERPLKSAVLSHGGRTEPVMVKSDAMGYRAPIYDKGTPNSARIRLTYR